MEARLTNFVIPLSGQKGVEVDSDLGSNPSLVRVRYWFEQTETCARQRYQFSLDENLPNAWTIPAQYPIASFGEVEFGAPLYVGQQVGFGLFAGCYWHSYQEPAAIRISVYRKDQLKMHSSELVKPVQVVEVPLPYSWIRWIPSDGGKGGCCIRDVL